MSVVRREVSCIAWSLASLALATIGCAPARQSPLDDDARQYVRLAVGLGERDPDSLDFYAGPAEAVGDIRRSPPPLAALRRDAEGLSAQIRSRDPDPVERSRTGTLVRDLAAIVTRIDVLTGSRLGYDDESRRFFGAVPERADAARLQAIRSAIAGIVGGEGRLVDRYAAFAARFTIPPQRLEPVMAAAVDACRRATLAHVPLPPGEQATLEYVRDKPWSAFSRYAGGGRSVIQINTDFRFTVDQALQVACHEGYPGHHTRNTLATSASDPGGRWPERSVQLTFSPESYQSEAVAMLAADAAFSPEERLRLERDQLVPLAGLDPTRIEQHIAAERLTGDLQIMQADIARQYLDGTVEFARAATALEEQALVPRAEALVKYINQYRSYVTTYTVGRHEVGARVASCAGPHPADDIRWRCFKIELAAR